MKEKIFGEERGWKMVWQLVGAEKMGEILMDEMEMKRGVVGFLLEKR